MCKWVALSQSVCAGRVHSVAAQEVTLTAATFLHNQLMRSIHASQCAAMQRQSAQIQEVCSYLGNVI